MVSASKDPDSIPTVSGGMESTASLLTRVKTGDEAARERLVGRYLPALHRWARGRLPSRARGFLDTDDLVQVTLLRALDKVMDFEPQRVGAFWAYLRRILQNQIRDQIRRTTRRPGATTLPETLADVGHSPLEEVIGRETLEAYERALEKLPDQQREAVLLRIELGFTHPEVAEAIGSPTPNAARMLVARGLARLAEVMNGKG